MCLCVLEQIQGGLWCVCPCGCMVLLFCLWLFPGVEKLSRQIPQGVCPSECLVWSLTSGGIFQEMAAGPPHVRPSPCLDSHAAAPVLVSKQQESTYQPW